MSLSEFSGREVRGFYYGIFGGGIELFPIKPHAVVVSPHCQFARNRFPNQLFYRVRAEIVSVKQSVELPVTADEVRSR